MREDSKHPMRVVARRTGLNPHVIRVWEKRYSAVSPRRTPTNRRLYADADIERLQLLRQATLAGHSIGQIARLPADELRTLIAADEAPAVPALRAAGMPPVGAKTHPVLNAALAAIERLDAAALEDTLARAAVAFSPLVVIEQVIVPLLAKIGDLWHEGGLRVAHEHLASAVVRTTLGHLGRGFAPSAAAPHLVATTPSGQLHELGALIVATLAASDGWRVVYLGPSLPAEEVAAAAHQHEAKAVALSIVYPADDPHLGAELRRLRRALPSAVVLLAGGRAVDAYGDVLAEIGAVTLTDLAQLRATLAALRQRQPGERPGR
jgi:MerR family transcriptional regulator, light-induced transcriptional regulator